MCLPYIFFSPWTQIWKSSFDSLSPKGQWLSCLEALVPQLITFCAVASLCFLLLLEQCQMSCWTSGRIQTNTRLTFQRTNLQSGDIWRSQSVRLESTKPSPWLEVCAEYGTTLCTCRTHTGSGETHTCTGLALQISPCSFIRVEIAEMDDDYREPSRRVSHKEHLDSFSCLVKRVSVWKWRSVKASSSSRTSATTGLPFTTFYPYYYQ